jgi:hypothetical protein
MIRSIHYDYIFLRTQRIRLLDKYRKISTIQWERETRAFYKNSSGGGDGRASTERDHILHWVTLSVEREMTNGCWWQKVSCGVVCRMYSKRGLYYSTPRIAFRAFSETDFWIFSVSLYTVDRLNLQFSICMVYLSCKYHNSVTNVVTISAHNTNIYKICKLCKAIFSKLHNISQSNSVAILIY